MQAGLVSKRISYREIFVVVPEEILCVIAFIHVTVHLGGVSEQKRAA